MSSVPSAPAPTVRYQDHIGSLSRTDSRAARVLSQSTRVHVLRDKLDDAAATRLELTAQSLGAQITTSPSAANVVVTTLRAPKRIRKHFQDDDLNVFPAPDPVPEAVIEVVDAPLGQGKDWRRFVVTPQWIQAVKDEGTLVDPDRYPAVPHRPTHEADRKRKRGPESPPPPPAAATSRAEEMPVYKPLEVPEGVPAWSNTRYACRRPSPLKCTNQMLVEQLELIRNERRLTGDTYAEMAYMRAISALKAYPFHIPDSVTDADFSAELRDLRLAEVEKLKGVGKKVFSLVRQFYHSTSTREARIVEAKVIQRDRAVFVMNAFAELYGIGPIGAREAYNAGARSFRDVLERKKSLATHLSAKESVRILADLRQPIGRGECESIAEEIMRLLTQLMHGAEVRWQICGGYRRGKPRTYDLDIIIGHTLTASRALHVQLLDDMKKRGLITHIVNISTPHPNLEADPDPSNPPPVHIDIANIVVLPPAQGAERPLHRRIDLVFCPLHVYGATVLGWTGSLTFERDLRLWARTKGFNFSFDGLTNLAENTLVPTATERDVFELLQLPYMPPEWRNCDA